MNTLWVDSIDVIEILHSIKDEVKTVSIKKNLLEGKFCVYDTKPLELVKGLAEKAGSKMTILPLDDVFDCFFFNRRFDQIQ